MGRRRKGPWFREQDQSWYTTYRDRPHKLGTAEQPYSEIEQAYHELLAKGQKPSRLTVAWLADEFLEEVQRDRSPSTYAWYKRYLDSCVKYVGSKLKADALTPTIVAKWVSLDYGHRTESTQHAAARSIVRLMNWAVAQQHLLRSPLVGYTKPQPGRREYYVSPDEYKLCLEHSTGSFRLLVEFLWESGVRPQEVRIIESRWVDGRKIVLPARRSKGKKRPRTIWLNERAAEIAVQLCQKHPTGPIFRNSRGVPWTKDSLACAFARLKKRTGIKELCATAVRHGFATRKLKETHDIAGVGVLMGHANPNMVAKIYQHLAQDDNHMLSLLDGGSVTGSGTPPVGQA